MDFTPQSRKLHGFTLIEAAIVLGIVGLVIGGIWVAAAAVRENQVVARTAEGILATCTRSVQIWTKGKYANGTSAIDRTSVAISANVFPSDWVSGSSALAPYGGHVYVVENPFGYSAAISLPADIDGTMSIFFGGMNRRLCIKVLQSMGKLQPGLVLGMQITTGPSATWADTIGTRTSTLNTLQAPFTTPPWTYCLDDNDNKAAMSCAPN